MSLELSHREARNLFFAFADDEIAQTEEARLRDHLSDCGDCRVRWDRYAKTVRVVKELSRERAPPALASMIVRRARRNRRMFGTRGLTLAHAHYRVPVETIIPVLIGAMVALFLVMLAP